MITFPNCKINLGLNIVNRRPDGYHDLETVFYPVPLTDVLEIVPARGDDSTLTCSGNPVDCPVEKNLVMRACRLMQRHYGVPQVDVFLHKLIPDGAGLGGGSSDASHAMLMLHDMFDVDATLEQLAALAATLGADCPFFIHNRPMMATGIGDKLAAVDLSLSGYTLLLVKPPVSVPTRVAYSRVTPRPSGQDLPQLLRRPVPQWQGVVKNDFEPSVFEAFPELAVVKRRLLEAGAVYAAMSGSGSSIYGLFDDVKVAERMRGDFAGCGEFVIAL